MAAPVKKFRIGNVTVNVWENEGPEHKFYTVDIQRRYKNDDDEWRNTTSLNHGDVLNVAHLLTRANAWIMEQ